MKSVLIDPSLIKKQGASFHEELIGFIRSSGLKIAIESQPKESKLWDAASQKQEHAKIYDFIKNDVEKLLVPDCVGIGDYSHLADCLTFLS